jgi:hypothetical protein
VKAHQIGTKTTHCDNHYEIKYIKKVIQKQAKIGYFESNGHGKVLQNIFP